MWQCSFDGSKELRADSIPLGIGINTNADYTGDALVLIADDAANDR